MKEPNFFGYALIVSVCLLLALIGLYLLANFSRLFRGTIKNEIVRRNVAAWLVIFFISASLTPMGGGFSILLTKYGWLGIVVVEIISTMVATIVGFNIVWAVAENRRLKRLSFIKHKLLLLITFIIMSLVINVSATYVLFNHQVLYIKYSVISSIYNGGAAGLVYAVISYLNIERKRKFDEKELELSRMRELKTKAELEALHSKINPHFLYNALNSIADLSVTDGKKARKMTIALADLFRFSINYSNNNFSTVKEEVEMTDVYLQIEKIRFEDQLTYSVAVDEELNHFLIPRFILQPIVENAVKHGLKATGRMTEITLEVKKKEEGLEINIIDNGPEFPDELNPGYGIKSIFDKLDLLFPGGYELRFTNEPRKQVSIYLKKLMKNEPAVQDDSN